MNRTAADQVADAIRATLASAINVDDDTLSLDHGDSIVDVATVVPGVVASFELETTGGKGFRLMVVQTS